MSGFFGPDSDQCLEIHITVDPVFEFLKTVWFADILNNIHLWTGHSATGLYTIHILDYFGIPVITVLKLFTY